LRAIFLSQKPRKIQKKTNAALFLTTTSLSRIMRGLIFARGRRVGRRVNLVFVAIFVIFVASSFARGQEKEEQRAGENEGVSKRIREGKTFTERVQEEQEEQRAGS